MIFNDVVKEVIKKYSINTIIDRVSEIYDNVEDSREGYTNLLNVLDKLKPCTIQNVMVIHIKHVHTIWDEDDIGDDIYENVFGISPDSDDTWALEYTTWDKWLGYEVDVKTLKNYSKIDIVAHCMWEMTWAGFDQKTIKSQIDEITGRMDDVKNGDVKCISLEEMRNELEKGMNK